MAIIEHTHTHTHVATFFLINRERIFCTLTRSGMMPKVPRGARCELDLGSDQELALMCCLTAETKNGFLETDIRSFQAPAQGLGKRKDFTSYRYLTSCGERLKYESRSSLSPSWSNLLPLQKVHNRGCQSLLYDVLTTLYNNYKGFKLCTEVY